MSARFFLFFFFCLVPEPRTCRRTYLHVGPSPTEYSFGFRRRRLGSKRTRYVQKRTTDRPTEFGVPPCGRSLRAARGVRGPVFRAGRLMAVARPHTPSITRAGTRTGRACARVAFVLFYNGTPMRGGSTSPVASSRDGYVRRRRICPFACAP